jgi:diaminopimelate decarboxylase
MHHFLYKGRDLYCEDVPVAQMAEAVGTPFYLYSHATLTQHFKAFDRAFEGVGHLICFSMKSNSNLSLLRLFSQQGGGVDIVSGGELYRALRAGVDPRKVVYSGVGKQTEEIEYALKTDILMFNAESGQEIVRINEVAGRVGKKARIAIRVNPDVDPKTHPYISTGLKKNKFGVDIREAVDQYALAARLGCLEVSGISCHIGSQLTEVNPFVDALRKVLLLMTRLRDMGLNIRYLDIGGGLGITYNAETPPHPDQYADALKREIAGSDLTLILEPGRVICGNAGILVTRVLYTKSTKEKSFIIVDAAMNDLMRPALYDSYHAIRPVRQSEGNPVTADIVGPICESGDFFAKSREVTSFQPGDLMAIMSAGAYGFSMSSNYNSRPRGAEVMVKGDRFYIIRERERYEDLVKGETIPDFLL